MIEKIYCVFAHDKSNNFVLMAEVTVGSTAAYFKLSLLHFSHFTHSSTTIQPPFNHHSITIQPCAILFPSGYFMLTVFSVLALRGCSAERQTSPYVAERSYYRVPGMSPLQPWPRSQCSSYTNSKYGSENSCSSSSVSSS